MKKYLLSAIIFLTVLLALFGCAPKTKPSEKAFPVKIAVVQPQTISSTLKLSGTVEAKMRATVIAPTEGNVRQIATAEGRRVVQGQVLCYLVSPDYQNILGQAEAELRMLKDKPTPAQVEDTKTLADRIKQAEERISAARKLYQPTPVVSPINGTVIFIRIETGDNVLAKQPLFDVADLSALVVRSAVSVDQIGKIRPGEQVRVTLQSQNTVLTHCTLGSITPSVRIESRTADIEVNLPRGINALPGEAAKVEITAEQKDKALVAPLDAVIVKPDGGKSVFIVIGGRAKMIPIELGIETNEAAEVRKGLSAGDSLVVWGQENLKDGVAVKLPEPSGGKPKQAGGK